MFIFERSSILKGILFYVNFIFFNSELILDVKMVFCENESMDDCEQVFIDATAKSPKNAAKTTATLQNQVGKVLLTLASSLTNTAPKTIGIIRNVNFNLKCNNSKYRNG